VGKPEPLKHELSGCWSRRINQGHRLVYQVQEDKIRILACRAEFRDLPVHPFADITMVTNKPARRVLEVVVASPNADQSPSKFLGRLDQFPACVSLGHESG